MSDPTAFVLAVAAILATPGPTNTLLASSGARVGLRGSWGLVPAELCGYVLAIAGWGFALEPASAALPWLKPVLRLACAAYLVFVAFRLWRSAGDMTGVAVLGPGRVFTATLLNPKALLFAVSVFPVAAFQAGGVFLQAVALFAAILVPVALAWIGFGAVLNGPKPVIRPRAVQQGAALVLLAFSGVIGAGALG